MQPAFHLTRLERLDEMITHAAGSMPERWHELYAAGQRVDLSREMGAPTLTVTKKALFGVDLGDEAREVGELVTEGVRYLEKPSNPHLVNSTGRLNAVVDRIIQQRKYDFHDEGDLLSSLIQTRDEKKRPGWA